LFTPKLVMLATGLLAAGIVGGFVLGGVAFAPRTAAPVSLQDPPGTVLVGADVAQSTPCAWSADPLEGVDAEMQAELSVLAACAKVNGKVQDITVVVRDEARVYHFTLLPDAEFASLSNAENTAQLKGALMIEVLPQHQGIIPRLHVGQHLAIEGAHVTDIDHGWNEIHPARVITVL
jgi:hypothetical protein